MADDVELVNQFLSRMESEDLDFKRDQYHLESDRQKSEFVKDIVSMANTPRVEPAYIIIGVATKNGRPDEVPGSHEHPDPATFQRLVNGNAGRAVQFCYRVLDYLGIQLGLFEIPVDRNIPVMVKRNFGTLKQGVVYTRRNAVNAEVDPHEIRRISDWANEKQPDGAFGTISVSSWESFYRACDGFDRRRLHMAVLGQEHILDLDACKAFAGVEWQLVVDFDQESDVHGIYSSAHPVLAEKKSLRLTALEEPLISISPVTSIWVAARGLASRPSTIRGRTWREWNQTKANPLSRVLSDVAQVTEPQPATAVILGGEEEYVRTVCNLLDQAFGDRLVFVFANEQRGTFSPLISQFDGTEVAISLPAICAGLRDMGKRIGDVSEVVLPNLEGGVVKVPPDRSRWLEEDLEIVHLDSGISSPISASELRDFLKGMPVSWFGLNLGIDVNRSATPRLEQRVTAELSSRTARRVNLWHWPGGGGSTVGRRVAWNLHAQFPTVVARRIVPDSLTARVQFLFSLTRLPILVLVEESVTTKDDMDRVYDRVRSANIPSVFLQIRRRETAPAQDSGVYVDGMLDTREAVAFAAKLATEIPDRKGELESLIDAEDRRRRTPFYFGLVAFGRDFVGLEPYVSRRLETSSDTVLTLCKISSLLYHFGQQSTPLQLLSPLLEVLRAREQRWLRKSEQGDKWNRCLIEGMIVLSETGARDEQTTPP